ncbi:hypothetical protein [Nonomuraea rosea]
MAEAVVLFILAKLAESAGTRMAEMVAREVLELQTAEVRLLTSIQESVDSLIAGPLNSGLIKLEAAMAAHRPPKERKRLLKEARNSFMDALGQETRPMNRSLAHFNLAIVWYLLDSNHDVPENLRQAHVEAAKAGVSVPGSEVRRSRFSGPPSPILDPGRLDYLNQLAYARRNWGSCSSGAPYFYTHVPFGRVLGDRSRPLNDPVRLAQAGQIQARDGMPLQSIWPFSKDSRPCQVTSQGTLLRCGTHPYGVAVTAAPG